jgi:1,3-beta-glucan synthase
MSYFELTLDVTKQDDLRRPFVLQRLKSIGGKQVKTAGKASLDSATHRWRNAMNSMSHYDRARQLALYLLCWGEAGNVRFAPACLCFIFKCADDYYLSPDCQNKIEPLPEGMYLETIIKPLCNYMRDQGYEVFDGKPVCQGKNFDNINQLFWYPEGLARIVTRTGTRILDIPPALRFLNLPKTEWNRVLIFKTYFEKRFRMWTWGGWSWKTAEEHTIMNPLPPRLYS